MSLDTPKFNNGDSIPANAKKASKESLTAAQQEYLDRKNKISSSKNKREAVEDRFAAIPTKEEGEFKKSDLEEALKLIDEIVLLSSEESGVDNSHIQDLKNEGNRIAQSVKEGGLSVKEGLHKTDEIKIEMDRLAEETKEQALNDLERELQSNQDNVEGEQIMEDAFELHNTNLDERSAAFEVPEGKSQWRVQKQAFREAEQKYHAAIEADHQEKGVFTKMFGGGRKNMSPELEAARNEFMAANKAYYDYAEQSGLNTKVIDRLNRLQSRNNEEPSSREFVLAQRHVNNPREDRLKMQSMEMPESVRRVNEKCTDFIRRNQKTVSAVAAGATVGMMFINPAALISMGAGFASRYIGQRKFIKGHENTQKDTAANTLEQIAQGGEIDFAKLEAASFDAENALKNSRNKVRAASLGVAAATGFAGGVITGGGISVGGGKTVEAAGEVFGHKFSTPMSDEVMNQIHEAVEKAAPTLDNGSVEGVDVLDFSGADASEQASQVEGSEFTPPPDLKPDPSLGEVGIDAEASADEQMAVTDTPEGNLGEDFKPYKDTVSPSFEDTLDVRESAIEGSETVDSIGEDFKPYKDTVSPSLEDTLDAEPESGSDGVVKQVLNSYGMPVVESSLNQTLSAGELMKESMLSAFEKVPAMQEVVSGDTVSQMLKDRVDLLVENGLVLPEGINMYNTFPEFFDPSAENPGFTAEQWEQLGVDSTNPSLIFPKDNIDMNAIVERMLEIHAEQNPDMTLINAELPSVGTEEALAPADAPVEGVQTSEVDGQLAGDAAVSESTETAAANIGGAEGSPVTADSTQTAEAVSQTQEGGLEPADTNKEIEKNIDTTGQIETNFLANDFQSLYENEAIGASHDFKNGPEMYDHVLSIMDEMPQEVRDKYLVELSGVDKVGTPFTHTDRHYLSGAIPEISDRVADIFSPDYPDRLDEDVWRYVGVPSGNPMELDGAVLDHERFFTALFDPNFSLDNLAVSAETAGLESAQAPEALPEELPKEQIIPNELESGPTESDQLRGYREDIPDHYTFEKIDGGEIWTNQNPPGDAYVFEETAKWFGSDFSYTRIIDGVPMGKDEALAVLAAKSENVAAKVSENLATETVSTESVDAEPFDMSAAVEDVTTEPAPVEKEYVDALTPEEVQMNQAQLESKVDALKKNLEWAKETRDSTSSEELIQFQDKTISNATNDIKNLESRIQELKESA